MLFSKKLKIFYILTHEKCRSMYCPNAEKCEFRQVLTLLFGSFMLYSSCIAIWLTKVK